jgi:hypothetical protein
MTHPLQHNCRHSDTHICLECANQASEAYESEIVALEAKAEAFRAERDTILARLREMPNPPWEVCEILGQWQDA